MQKDETTLADREARLIEQLNERAKLIVELLQMIRFGNQGFAGGIHIQRARRIIDGLPEAIAEGEANYRAYCLASPDHVHEGTLEELATCARMLDEYGIKEMPANEKGQIEFNRALMESTVGAINAYIVNHRQATEARMEERVRAETAFQDRVKPWLLECFGPVIAAHKLERCDRLIEEALEHVQACDYDQARAHDLVDYVFGRPIGEPSQEVGGVMVTLAALCLAHHLDMQGAGETELARILRPEIVAKIRAKQAAKPTGSALPIAIRETPHAEG